MAKKEFTDMTIRLCQKDCYFKRVTNNTLSEFADKADKEYESSIKEFVDEVEVWDSKRQSLEKKIALKNRQVALIEKKHDVSDDELDKMFTLLEEVEHYEDELETVKVKLMELDANSPTKDYLKRVDELLAIKVETLLDGITASEFLEKSDPVDTIKARNLEKYYQLCIVGESEARIVDEMKQDVDNFLKSQRELRESE